MTSQGPNSAPAFATIATLSYLAHARALAKSVKRHCPGSRVYVLILDERPFDDSGEPFTAVRLDALAEPEIVQQMSFYYSLYEFCGNIRPWLQEYLLKKEERVIFLDSDIRVFGSFEPLLSRLLQCNVVLTPHFTTPAPRELELRYERGMLISGLYNGGVIALKRAPETSVFLSWLKNRVRFNGFLDPPNGFFCEQNWLSAAPLFFKGIESEGDMRINVAYWNMHERQLSKDTGGQYLINGKPLICFHFSGWSPQEPERFTRDAGKDFYAGHPVLSELLKNYHRELLENGYEECRHTSYPFHFFKNRQPVSSEMKKFYFKLVKRGKGLPSGSPFENYEEIRSGLQMEKRKELRNRLRAFKASLLSRLIPQGRAVS